ncbi:MAG: hypothetical protein PVJ01_01870, partial [Pseudomonadota bacterium]
IHGYEITGQSSYLDGARGAADFILKAPRKLDDREDMLCLSYVPDEKISMAVMDVSALCGALCAMVGRHAGNNTLLDEARRLVNWVVDKQTDYGAWFYTHPAGDSHITHDNYHTGEIVDALLEYAHYSRDEGFSESWARGLAYYRQNLFTGSFRPKWMNDREYPYDIHGYSQGIITFTLAGEIDEASKVAQAAIEDMWNDQEDRFYYQKRRARTMTYTPMRWAQGWMCFALSCLATGAGRSVP